MMFSGLPFEPLMPLAMSHFAQDPWATCSPSMGCRSQSYGNPGYITGPVRVAAPVVRRAPVPRPQQLNAEDRVRIVRDQQAVAVLIELPGFSRDELSIEVKNQSLDVSASTSPSIYYRFGATFAQSFRLGDNIDTDAITAKYQGGLLTLHLPYKAPKSNAPRRILVEGPSSPSLQITGARRPSLSPPASPVAAAPAPASPTPKKAAPTPASVQPRVESADFQQEEWVDVQENPTEQREEQAKQPTLPAKEHMSGQLPAFEPVVQFVGESSGNKDSNTDKGNSEPMTAEEKAAAWVADLEEEDPHADVEDGSIEDCEV